MPDLTSQESRPQPGWLGYSSRTADRSSGPEAKAGTSTSTGFGAAGFLTSGKDGQSRARNNSRDLDSEIADAWRSSKPSSRPDTEPRPVERARRRRGGGSWVMWMVALLILGAIAFLVWKFVFGPATFTDPEHGYSFSHPGRWKVIEDGPMASQFEYLTGIVQMPDLVTVGKDLDSDDPDQAALVAVARSEVRSSVDGSMIATQIQRDLYLASNSGISLSVIDPAHPITVGGLNAWTTTVSTSVGGHSVTVTYCALLDGSTAYVLMAAATSDAWAENRETFDRFFNSFDPG